MPLPKPKDGESKDEWIERCMGNEAMKSEFPDNDQRLAVCHQRWEDKGKKSAEPAPERRYFPVPEFRVEEEEGEPVLIGGYAAVFDRWSEDLGWFKEKIQKGAFAKSIVEHDIRALINHDPNLIIGRTKNKTLKLWEDDEGLGFEVKLPETTYAQDLVKSIKRKDITQNSFGFQVVSDEWSKDQKKRTLLEVRLFDVSPVTFPAYKQTSLSMRLYRMGIDYEALTDSLLRAEQGVATSSDVDLFNSIMGILQRYAPMESRPLIVAPAAPEHPEDRAEPLIVAPAAPEHSEPESEPEVYAAQIRARIASMAIRSILGGRA